MDLPVWGEQNAWKQDEKQSTAPHMGMVDAILMLENRRGGCTSWSKHRAMISVSFVVL